MARRALILGVLAVLVPATSGGQDARGTARTDAGSAAKRCARHPVGTKRVCLRAGQRCTPLANYDYLKARLECRRGRLRRAGLAALRRGEPVLINGRGQIDPRNALEAFDTAIAPLPGVTPRKGAVGRIADGTPIVAAVAAQRSRLTLAQRAVLDRVLEPGPRATEAAVDPADVAAFAALAAEARQRVANHGYPVFHKISVAFPDTDVVPISGVTAPAYAWPGWLDPSLSAPDRCAIYITPAGRAQSLDQRRRTVAHEMFHCAQFEHFASAQAWHRVPQWVMEGSATWAGDVIGREWNGFELQEGAWSNWLNNPALDLGQRMHDAIGFFAMLQQSGIDVFEHTHGVLTAGAASGDSSAYAVATAGAPPSFWNTWGPGLQRNPLLGDTWNLTGTGIIPSKPPDVTIANGASFVGATADRGSMGARLNIQSDLVEFHVAVARGRYYASNSEQPLANRKFCTKPGGCFCPKGERIEADYLPKGNLAIGWMGGYVDVSGKKECDEKPTGEGIMVFELRGGSPQIVARFRSGRCSASRGTFQASARDGARRLLVTIHKYGGFGNYALQYRSTNPSFSVSGLAGGPFSNTPWPGGTPPRPGGRIVVGPEHLGLAFINSWNRSTTKAIGVAGLMNCHWPPP